MEVVTERQGKQVWSKLEPGNSVMLHVGRSQHKLDTTWRACYEITEALDHDSYMLINTQMEKAKPVRRHRRFIRAFDKSRLTDDEADRLPKPDNKYRIEQILDERPGASGLEVLVQWSGFAARMATWEPADQIDGTDAWTAWRSRQPQL
jgi:hypothetical protein